MDSDQSATTSLSGDGQAAASAGDGGTQAPSGNGAAVAVPATVWIFGAATDRMFLVAAATLADRVTAQRISEGAWYPGIPHRGTPASRIAERRNPASRNLGRIPAVPLSRAAAGQASGVAQTMSDDWLEAAVDAATWVPDYSPVQAPCGATGADVGTGRSALGRPTTYRGDIGGHVGAFDQPCLAVCPAIVRRTEQPCKASIQEES